MDTAKIENQILQYTKGLPKESLQEILDFIRNVRKKRKNSRGNDFKNVNAQHEKLGKYDLGGQFDNIDIREFAHED